MDSALKILCSQAICADTQEISPYGEHGTWASALPYAALRLHGALGKTQPFSASALSSSRFCGSPGARKSAASTSSISSGPALPTLGDRALTTLQYHFAQLLLR